MKRAIRKFVSSILTIVVLTAVYPCAFAMENHSFVKQVEENHILFENLAQLAPGESLEYVVETEDGEVVVGIKHVPESRCAGERVWQVWYKGLNTDVEFYMIVSNNKVTSVYDYSISLVGGSYEDAVLTKTTTYGKLTFKAKAIFGLSSSTCWLKGTVTGENDDIEVTWQM